MGTEYQLRVLDLFLGGSLHAINDEELAWPIGRLELQSELLDRILYRGNKGRVGRGGLGTTECGDAMRTVKESENSGRQLQMKIKSSGNPGFVDDRTIEGHQQKHAKVRHSRRVKLNPGMCQLTPSTLSLRVRNRWIVRIPRNASSLKWLKIRSARRHRQCINRNFSALAMYLQLKPVFEKRSQHGSIHHCLAFIPAGFSVDLIKVRISPGRAARDRNSRQRILVTIREETIRLLDEALHGGATRMENSGR